MDKKKWTQSSFFALQCNVEWYCTLWCVGAKLPWVCVTNEHTCHNTLDCKIVYW